MRFWLNRSLIAALWIGLGVQGALGPLHQHGSWIPGGETAVQQAVDGQVAEVDCSVCAAVRSLRTGAVSPTPDGCGTPPAGGFARVGSTFRLAFSFVGAPEHARAPPRTS